MSHKHKRCSIFKVQSPTTTNIPNTQISAAAESYFSIPPTLCQALAQLFLRRQPENDNTHTNSCQDSFYTFFRKLIQYG